MHTAPGTKGMLVDKIGAIKNAIYGIILLSPDASCFQRETEAARAPAAHAVHEVWLCSFNAASLPERYHLVQGQATDFCVGFSGVDVSELAGYEALLGDLGQNHRYDCRTRQPRKEACHSLPVASPADTPLVAKISNIRRFCNFRAFACHFFRIADDFCSTASSMRKTPTR